MKTCKQCGRAMDDLFNVCPYCGFSINTATENEQAPSGNNYIPEENGGQNQYEQQSYSTAYRYSQPETGHSQPNQGPNYGGGYYQQNHYSSDTGYTPSPRPQRSAYIAGILAIVGGMFGLHNFYLDNTKRATIQLAVSVLGIFLTFGIASIAMEVWAVTEGIKILKGEINTDGTGAMIKMGW